MVGVGVVGVGMFVVKVVVAEMFGAEGVDGRRCAELAVWDSEWPADHWAPQSRVTALPDAGRIGHKEPSFDLDCEPSRLLPRGVAKPHVCGYTVSRC